LYKSFVSCLEVVVSNNRSRIFVQGSLVCAGKCHFRVVLWVFALLDRFYIPILPFHAKGECFRSFIARFEVKCYLLDPASSTPKFFLESCIFYVILSLLLVLGQIRGTTQNSQSSYMVLFVNQVPL
jgi:hypothetical protein